MLLLTQLKKHVYSILHTYRYVRTDCTVLICCPRHEGYMSSYISLDELTEGTETMCHHDEGWHLVSIHEALGSWYSNNIEVLQISDPNLQRPVDEKMLTRLAKALNHDGPNSLASKLQLDNTWCVASRAKVESKRNKEIARFLVMMEWKRLQDESTSTVGKLKDLLTRLQVYTWENLKSHIDGHFQQKQYEVDATLLRQKPCDRDCMHISRELTDPRYIFLFIELGLTHVDIQRAQANTCTMYGTEGTVNKLLTQWKEQHHETATLQVLLDTLSMLQMDTHQIVQKMKPPQAAKKPIFV